MRKSTEIQSPVSQIIEISTLPRLLTPCDHAIVISLCCSITSHPKYHLDSFKTRRRVDLHASPGFLVILPEFFISWFILAFLSNFPARPPPPLDP